MRRKTLREPISGVRLAGGGHRIRCLSVLRALERPALFTAAPASALPGFSVILAGAILVSLLVFTGAGPMGASETGTESVPLLGRRSS